MPSLPDIYVALFSTHGWEYANCEVRHDNSGANGLTLYSGMAQDNASTSDPAWLIAKFIYNDTTGFLERIRFSRKNSIWDDRTQTSVFP